MVNAVTKHQPLVTMKTTSSIQWPTQVSQARELTSNNIATVTMSCPGDYHILSPYRVAMVSIKSAPTVYVFKLFFSLYIKSTHEKVKPRSTKTFSSSARLQNAQLSQSSTSSTTPLKQPCLFVVALRALVYNACTGPPTMDRSGSTQSAQVYSRLHLQLAELQPHHQFTPGQLADRSLGTSLSLLWSSLYSIS